ncbi:MAG: ATP-binding protein [Acidobacteriota bacterium]
MEIQVEIQSSFDCVDDAIQIITAAMQNGSPLTDQRTLFSIRFALRELLNNAVEHGNALQIQKMVRCTVSYIDGLLTIDITDEGSGFRMENTVTESIPVDSERNRGIRTLELMGFKIAVRDNHVQALLVF